MLSAKIHLIFLPTQTLLTYEGLCQPNISKTNTVKKHSNYDP